MTTPEGLTIPDLASTLRFQRVFTGWEGFQSMVTQGNIGYEYIQGPIIPTGEVPVQLQLNRYRPYADMANDERILVAQRGSIRAAYVHTLDSSEFYEVSFISAPVGPSLAIYDHYDQVPIRDLYLRYGGDQAIWPNLLRGKFLAANPSMAYVHAYEQVTSGAASETLGLLCTPSELNKLAVATHIHLAIPPELHRG